MPKLTKYPRLRTKLYRGANGQAYTYYVYDMRPEGKPDVRLGKDWAEAVRQWDELHNRKPRTIGRLQEAFDKFEAQELPQYENKETAKSYAKHIRRLAPVFGQMVWEEVTLPILRKYLDLRTAKSQGNRELAVMSIVWNRAKLWGMHGLPWPALGVKKWKNPEPPREFEVTDELFEAVYKHGDQVLRDCMDIASATGLRLTDARTVRVPGPDGALRIRANKTKKWIAFDVAASPVLSALVERRAKTKTASLMLLTTATGRQVSEDMLRNRWEAAREKAAQEATEQGQEAFAESIRSMYLRDMRKRAAALAGGLAEATELLQHDNPALTRKHYPPPPKAMRPVR